MIRPLRPLHLAKNMRDLNKLVTHPSYGRKLNQLCKASDKLARSVFDTNLELPVDEERVYILCMRYIHLVNNIKTLIQDERFFMTRFGSSLKKIKLVKEDATSSLNERYEIIEAPVSPAEKKIVLDLNDTTVPVKNKIHKDDIFFTTNKFYQILNDEAVKVLVLDARPASEFQQCFLKYEHAISIPGEVIHKGLSTNTLQQKLSKETADMFKTRHTFDYIVLVDLDTNRISYQTTKLHDLRTILVDWDLDQNYQTLPVVLDGGLKALVDHYPTLINNPGVIFNQLLNHFDDFIGDDIEYPDVSIMDTPEPIIFEPPPEVSPSEDELPLPSGDTESPITSMASRLLTICDQQLQLEDKLLNYTIRRSDTRRKMCGGKLTKQEAQTQLAIINKDISIVESYRIELDERRRLIRKDFDDRCSSAGDVSYLDYMLEDIANLDARRLSRYKKRKQLEVDDTEFEKNAEIRANDPMAEIKTKPKIPVPDRSTKPQAINTLEMEINTLIANYGSAGVTGLANIKNTCYMNALVQCLRFCPSISYFFTMRTFPPSMSMSNAFGELIKKLWTESRGSLRPQNFYNEACNIQSHDYSTGEHEDIHEFFMDLTDLMHKELSEPLETSGDCTSHLSDWHKAFKSKISFMTRAFFYQLEATTSCTRCNTRIVKYDYNNNVFISIENDDERPINVQNEVDKTVFLCTDAKKYCSRCEAEMRIRHQITYYPNILVVNLMRYTYSIKDKCVLRLLNEAHFPLELMFGHVKYNLCAIACHTGNKDRGHYTACCYHPSTKRWVEYNDETCTMTKVSESGYRVRAYMLFYSMSPVHDGINRHFFQS